MAEPPKHGDDGPLLNNDGTPLVRFGEPLKFVPVLFVWVTIFYIWYIYNVHHCIPLLEGPTHAFTFLLQVIFNFVTAMLTVCYVQCIRVHPGLVPAHDPRWDYTPSTIQGDVGKAKLQETKKTGERRHCKWCGKYKPDRCHHCRVCGVCILKMDHHCPWIYNCVGFYNYKYFILLLLYSALACDLVVLTMSGTVLNTLTLTSDLGFGSMFVVTFCHSLALFLGALLTLFFMFHIWMISKAMTTIEFCEKNVAVGEGEPQPSPYDRGFVDNLFASLGDNPLFWLLPIPGPSGNGLSYETARSPVAGETLI